MTRTEATRRQAVAMGAADPMAALGYVAVLMFAFAFRCAVHLCIGFGTASLLSVSAWWGLPVALLSGQTLGRLREWWRRDAEVEAIETMARQSPRSPDAR